MLQIYNNNMKGLFSQFGLNNKETVAFLELVSLGAKPISIWAKHAGVNRSSMYVLLKRLEKAGLVSVFIHKNIQHAKAIPVAELPALLNDKEKEIESTRLLLKKHLPQLQGLEKTRSITPRVKFYEGIHKVEAMYEEVLKELSFKSFFHPGRVKSVMPEYFYKIPEILRERGGKAQELLVSCREATEYRETYQSEGHRISILPNGVTFSSDTIITKQKIYLVGYGNKEVVGTEIWNEELAQTQTKIFDLLWAFYAKPA